MTVFPLTSLGRFLQVTVLPSHVDVRTQATYQLMDESFVGVILSCFSRAEVDGAGSVDRVQLGAFKSLAVGAEHQMLVVPVQVVSEPAAPLSAALAQARLQDILLQEERAEFDNAVARATTQIAAVHACAIYDTSVCRVLQYSVAPLCRTLQYEAVQLELDLERQRARELKAVQRR